MLFYTTTMDSSKRGIDLVLFFCFTHELPIGGRADRMGFQLRRGLLAIVAQTYVLSIGEASPATIKDYILSQG